MVHRYPRWIRPSGCMKLAVHVRDHYDGDAARVWTERCSDLWTEHFACPTSTALPGFGAR